MNQILNLLWKVKVLTAHERAGGNTTTTATHQANVAMPDLQWPKQGRGSREVFLSAAEQRMAGINQSTTEHGYSKCNLYHDGVNILELNDFHTNL